MIRRNTAIFATLAALTLAVAACGGDTDPLDPALESDDDPADQPERQVEDTSLVVGSQDYYSNEIVAEIYAQALEAEGFEVSRNFSIGQRDAYIPALEAGEVDVFPEYTGNLLQFYDPDTEATASDDVYAELLEALPQELVALEQADATDQDSYNVTADFAAEYNLNAIGDLADVDGEVNLGGPPELEQRPYGPQGLQEIYGVEVSFIATGDTTVQDLVAGTVDVANVFSADPRIQTEDLVTLEDTEGMFLASHVVPLVNAEVADDVAPIINAISASLTAEDLVAMNVQSTEDQQSSADIAAQWLADAGLVSTGAA
ncbi:MAG TPA: ABC transporter substrate-binding protein [Beutenbergiaceae bacterium]|nr:ABC transporter substrate-binding protein [Beutenbergiaceae bacterium]